MINREKLSVWDMGGAITVPNMPDIEFLDKLITFITNWLEQDSERHLILVIGGGGPARIWQKSAKKINQSVSNDSLDWIGIMATRLNAELIRSILGKYAPDPVVTNPSDKIDFTGRVLLGAGWKPGFSTDYDTVLLADQFGADTLIMLSNISQVYDSDPKKNPNALALDNLNWDEYLKLTGNKWTPGANLPFDPIAAKFAKKKGLKVIAADGRNLQNLQNILDGKNFIGTTIANP